MIIIVVVSEHVVRYTASPAVPGPVVLLVVGLEKLNDVELVVVLSDVRLHSCQPKNNAGNFPRKQQ